MVETGPLGISDRTSVRSKCADAVSSMTGAMNIIFLSLICSAVIGIVVAVFLRIVKVFDAHYDEFEDERHRAAVGTLRGRKLSQKDPQ